MTAHEKTSIAYRPTRDESEEIIRMLCEHYPKCFFEEPRRRLPLKKNITTDIIKDGDFDVSPEMIGAAMEWYTGHIGYDYATAITGAKRIDLEGNPVGTITKQEALAAQQRIADKGSTIAMRNEINSLRW